MSYSVSLLGSHQEFLELDKDWTDFISNCEADHPFNTHRWLSIWWQSFAEDAQPEVLVVREKGQLVCCVPMVTERAAAYGMRVRRRSLWVNGHSFRSGLLCDRRHVACLDDAVDGLMRSGDWDVFDLQLLPRDYEVHRAFKDALTNAGLKYTVTPHMDSPRLALEGDWNGYLATLSRSRRESMRRKVRKLIEREGATVTILAGVTDVLGERLEDCWEVSRKTWKHAAGSSIAADAARMDFYTRIATEPNNWIVLSLLDLNGRTIAFEYDLLYKGVLYNLKLGFDEEFKRLSPGYVLRVKLLHWAFDKGVKVYDYMGFGQDYKNQFSSGVLDHEHLRVYGKRLKSSFLYNLEDRVKPIYRRVKRWTRRS